MRRTASCGRSRSPSPGTSRSARRSSSRPRITLPALTWRTPSSITSRQAKMTAAVASSSRRSITTISRLTWISSRTSRSIRSPWILTPAHSSTPTRFHRSTIRTRRPSWWIWARPRPRSYWSRVGSYGRCAPAGWRPVCRPPRGCSWPRERPRKLKATRMKIPRPRRQGRRSTIV